MGLWPVDELRDNGAVRKVWRILVWVALALLLAVGGLALWLPHWAMNGYHEMQRTEAHTNDLRKICAQQLQRQTGITGHPNETPSGAGGYSMSQTGYRGPKEWYIYGSWLTSEQQRKHFACKVQQQGGEFTILDVHFSP